jgi:hypothetical protein
VTSMLLLPALCRTGWIVFVGKGSLPVVVVLLLLQAITQLFTTSTMAMMPTIGFFAAHRRVALVMVVLLPVLRAGSLFIPTVQPGISNARIDPSL